MKPSIFEKKFKDGSQFRASDSFIQKFLHGVMGWSMQQATQVAQKLPKNWEDQCEKSFFRKAYSIREWDIPIELYVNSDQTQIVYAPGNRLTWTQTGSKQVAIVGMDEKQAFTLLVSVATDGTILPFQAIYFGKMSVSLLSKDTPCYDESMAAGFKIKPSCTKIIGQIKILCIHLLMISLHLILRAESSLCHFHLSKKSLAN